MLELAAKYVPSDNNEIFDIMNLLEDRLQHANGAVVLATTKVFLQLTLSMADVHQQVYINFVSCGHLKFQKIAFYSGEFAIHLVLLYRLFLFSIWQRLHFN